MLIQKVNELDHEFNFCTSQCHQGQFGDFEDKKGDDLLKITEKKNLLIVQIVQFKNSNIPIESIDIDGLKLKDLSLIHI